LVDAINKALHQPAVVTEVGGRSGDGADDEIRTRENAFASV
jgi:hypothetical protein